MFKNYYHNSPLGTLIIRNEGDFITGILFAETERNTHEIRPTETADPAMPAIIRTCMQKLDAYFSGEDLSLDFPAVQTGTAFQQKVWKLLPQILPGKTSSYMTLSKRFGDPKAIRAIGTANGQNKIAIAVPCHRVVGSDGSLVGYAGDLWRKKWLLDHEAKYANGVQMLF